MKLTDFDNREFSKQALKENYNLPFDISTLSKTAAKNMLSRVRGLISEAKQSSDFYKTQANPTYMKLVFMEQALATHFNSVKATPVPRIVVENEEVEKSQVVLAAQDMVDSVQKMLEDVSDMLVKELPALVDSIQSEIGVNESEQFNTQVSEALSGITAALTQSKATLQSALNVVTGQGGGFEDAMAGEEGMPGEETFGDEMDGEMPAAPEEMGAEVPAEMPPEEAPEAPPVAGAGRAKR